MMMVVQKEKKNKKDLLSRLRGNYVTDGQICIKCELLNSDKGIYIDLPDSNVEIHSEWNANGALFIAPATRDHLESLIENLCNLLSFQIESIHLIEK